MNWFGPNSEGETKFATELHDQPLAFTSSSDDSSWVTATSRHVLETADGTAALNVELFPGSHRRLLLWVHGVCESAETLGVQHLVQRAKQEGVSVAVLELEGHGLSSGRPSLCGDFDRLVRHTLEFVSWATTAWPTSGDETETATPIPYILGGSSMGGALAIYAAEILARRLSGDSTVEVADLTFGESFVGVVPVAPALGVDSSSLPPGWIVSTLGLAAKVLPSAQVPLTPLEDPTHYNCPPDTKRNFVGHWPLATSKMLLDLSATRIPQDVQERRLTLQHVPHVAIIAGAKDHYIPTECVETFHSQVASPDKQLLIIPQAGHDVLVESKTCPPALDVLFALFDKK